MCIECAHTARMTKIKGSVPMCVAGFVMGFCHHNHIDYQIISF